MPLDTEFELQLEQGPVGKAAPGRLLLTAVDCYGRTIPRCDFRASVNRGAFYRVAGVAPGRAALDLPAEPRPLRLEVLVTPTTSSRWERTGNFELQANGNLTPVETPFEFLAPRPIVRRGVTQITSLPLVLPRVRDVTTRVLQSLAVVPDDKRYPGYSRARIRPPRTWDTPELKDRHYIAMPPLVRGDQWVPQQLSFDVRTVRPDVDNVVLEVAGITAPKLIAVSFPRSLSRLASSDPTPFLIYFRPTVGQNVETRFGGGRKIGPGYYIAPGRIVILLAVIRLAGTFSSSGFGNFSHISVTRSSVAKTARDCHTRSPPRARAQPSCCR